MGFSIPSVVVRKETGDLLVTRRAVDPCKHFPDGGYECSPIDKSYAFGIYRPEALEPAPARTRRQRYDFRTDLEPRLQGMLPWEVIEPADLSRTLQNIACCAGWSAYPGIAWVTKPGQRHPSWARVFLQTTQGGGYTGEAHALVSESGGAYGYPDHLRQAVIDAATAAVHKPKAPAGDLAAAVLAMESAHRWISAAPTAWRLAICKHEVKSTGSHYENMRGWHPAHCVKCGLDLSVDSSD